MERMAGFGKNSPNTKKQKIIKNGSKFLEEAIKAHQAGDIIKAEALYLNTINSGVHNATAFSNLGVIYKNSGRYKEAIGVYKRAISSNPKFAEAYTNLGNLLKDLGKLDQALACTLKSIELKPEASKALYSLGTIKMALGETQEAKKYLLYSIKSNPQEYGAYFELSRILNTTEEAVELIDSIASAKPPEGIPLYRSLIEFAISNCFHKVKNYAHASKHLKLANKYKLIDFPSNAKSRQQDISNNLPHFNSPETTTINTESGKGRIFIVGMPRSVST